MSDTPRTDKAIFAHYDEMFDEEFEYVEPQFARNLEREADKLAKQCVRNVEEIGQLRAQLESETKRRLGAEACLKSWKEDEGADAKRMNYIVENNIFGITRDYIDKDMEAQIDEY